MPHLCCALSTAAQLALFIDVGDAPFSQPTDNGTKQVAYNVSLADKLLVEPAVLGSLVGTCENENDSRNKTEIFIKDHQLWRKGNSQNGMSFGASLIYMGDNTFVPHGLPVEELCYVFEVLPKGVIKMKRVATNSKGKMAITVSVRKK